MPTDGDAELGATLDAARRPVDACVLPRASLRTRLATSPRLRGLAPRAALIARAQAHGRERWEQDPQARDRARAALRAIVGGTERAGEIEALAREHLIERAIDESLFWGRWEAPALDGISRTRLGDALSRPRGLLVSSCHTGPYLLALSVLPEYGRIPYSAAGPWSFEDVKPGYWGRRIAHRRNQARARDERLVYSIGSFPVLRSLLEEGELVSVFFGMPGGRETTFLGKPVMLTSGSARLAVASDALILPVRTRIAGSQVRLDVAEAIDPREHDGVESVHDALAAVHERWILERPAALEDPNRPGSWEGCATERGWPLPASHAGARRRSSTDTSAGTSALMPNSSAG